MDALLIGYARVSTDDQDVTAQRDALTGLGVTGERIYVDHGLTGSNRDRPSSTASRAPYPTRERSSPTSPHATSSSASAALSTTPPTRWGGCSSTCWPWSPSSKPT